VCDISISADGYSAGHNQTEEHSLVTHVTYRIVP
jgi:hypothetical protein